MIIGDRQKRRDHRGIAQQSAHQVNLKRAEQAGQDRGQPLMAARRAGRRCRCRRASSRRIHSAVHALIEDERCPAVRRRCWPSRARRARSRTETCSAVEKDVECNSSSTRHEGGPGRPGGPDRAAGGRRRGNTASSRSSSSPTCRKTSASSCSPTCGVVRPIAVVLEGHGHRDRRNTIDTNALYAPKADAAAEDRTKVMMRPISLAGNVTEAAEAVSDAPSSGCVAAETVSRYG